MLLIPQGVGTLLSRSWGGRATDTLGPRFVGVLGFSVVALATVPFAFANANTSQVWLMFALLVRGMGLGVLVAPIMSVAYIGLERDKMPDASIMTRIAQQFGGSIGVAVLAVVLEAATRHSDSVSAFASGFDKAFGVATAFTAAAAVLALLLPRTTGPIGAAAPAETRVAAE
jgi:hypothetical protein